MATEKFIRGKQDDCNHDGLYSNRKRLAQAEYHLANWQDEVVMEEGVQYNVPEILQDNAVRHQQNLSRLHGFFYKGTYYHHGIAQTSGKK